MSRWRLVLRSLGRGRLVWVLLAVVTGLATAFVVAVPRHTSGAVDRALGDAVASSPAQAREITLTVDPRPLAAPSIDPERGAGSRPPFERVDTAVRSVLGPDVLGLLGAPSYAAQSDPLLVTRASGERVTPDRVQVVLRVQSGLDRRVRWVAGAAPGAPDRARASGSDAREVQVVPVAVSAGTAQRWGLEVGDELDLTPETGTSAAAVLTGVFEPVDPGDGFWDVEPRLTGIATILQEDGGVIQEGSLVAAPEAYGAVSDALWRVTPTDDDGSGSPALSHSWRYPLRPDALRAADVQPLRSALVRLDSDARIPAALPQRLRVTTGLGAVLERYESSVAATRVLTSFATVGIASLAVLILTLTAGLGVTRRAAETRMLRARGASAALVGGVLAADAGLVVVPAGALGVGLGHLLVAGRTPPPAWAGVALVVLVPLVTVVTLGALRVRALDRRSAGSTSTVRLRRGTRRIVLEVGVLAAAGFAVATVRSRGSTIAAGTTDWYAALTPTLVALAVSVVTIRTLPPLLRRLARSASRRPGLVGFLGLARAARTGTVAVLPVAAVVVGATVLGLVATASLTVRDQREAAAYRAVGADVRVDAVRVDPDDLEALGARTGVRGVAEAYTDPAASVEAADGPRQVLLVAVDPARYAQVLQGTPLEADLPAVPPSADRLPALVSPGLEVDDDSVLVVRQTDVPIGPVAVVPGLGRVAAGRDSPVVLVPLAGLRQRVPLVQANTAFVEATPAAADALSVVPPDELTPGGLVTGVETADRVAAGVSGLALPSLVTATYTAAGAFAVLLTLLAVLLVLAATHDERTALAVRLRVLGMARGVDRAVAWTEVLPVVVVAALAGGVVGTLAPWLVSAAVDLAPFTGAVSRVPVPPRPALALAAAGSVVALGALALVLDALAARRGSLADHLRQGASA